MSRYAIDLDLSKCVSCGACAVACMDQNDISIAAGQRPPRSVFDLEFRRDGTVRFSHLSLACMHCENAPCIAGCPSACLRKDPETNLTVFDTTNCISCHSCAMACPFGVPSFLPDGTMSKCDGCCIRIHHGMLPACVKACPTDALCLTDLDADPVIPDDRSLRRISLSALEKQV